MHAPAGDVPVEQTRILVATGDDWRVLFSDGRPFHDWSPGVSVSHACAPDDYRGIVSADAPGADWTMRWQAVGPAKDYTIDTVYRRAMS